MKLCWRKTYTVLTPENATVQQADPQQMACAPASSLFAAPLLWAVFCGPFACHQVFPQISSLNSEAISSMGLCPGIGVPASQPSLWF